MSDLIGRALGKYHIVARLGRGGMATVYKAHQPGLDRYVAVKTLHSHLADQEGFVKRFKREGAALARLRHPNIMQVHDFDAQGDLHYLVTEFIEGTTLQTELEERRCSGQAFDLTEIAQICEALASAIDYAHSQGIVHRDLKPANIMFTSAGRVVLTDFGIVRIIGSTRYTATGAIGGTPDYMSPEQCRGEQADARSDIYSLGVTLYELLTGQVPFTADTPFGVILKHINEPPPLPTAIKPDIPWALEQVILKALNKDADDRYQTAGAMAAALRQALEMPADQYVEARIAQVTIPLPPPIDLVADEQAYKPGVPFQAPADIPRFVGREQELADLSAALAEPGGQNAYCITGMGGIGKTTLAIHIAHTCRERFPDGVLWANTATSEPLAILDSWARAYECDFSSLPDLESRAAALRGVLADKRILVILDDVWTADQVRPLFPGGQECVTLLTTRDLELAVSLGVGVYPLSALTLLESRQLMACIVGAERVQAEEVYADEVCALLGNLPLAVEIASQRLASRRRWKLADLAARLRDEKNRLHELKISDREVRASFALSWEALDEDLRRSFAALAAFEGRSFSAPAFAATAELNTWTAEDHLYALVALSLVSEEGETHFRQHPLLADFAREQLGEDEDTYARMARYYLAYAVDHQRDYAELEQEWDNLLAGMRTAHQQEMRQVVIDYADTLTNAWFARGRFIDARQGYAWAYEAAQALEDRQALASCLRQWGRACIEQSDYVEAEGHLSRSLEISGELGDQRGIASVQCHLGWIAIEQADFDKAQRLLAESQRIREQLDDVFGVAETIYWQATVHYHRSNHEKAEQLGKQALDMQQAVGDKLGCIRTLRVLTDVALHGMDDYELAESHCQRALELCEELQDQGELAAALTALSEVCRRRGNPAAARTHAEKSLTLFTRQGDRRLQAHTLYRLCLVDADLKDYALAIQEGLQSLDLCRELRDTWGTVYVLLQLGDIFQSTGQPDRAYEMWSEALGIAQELQHPSLESLRERLDQRTAEI